MIPEGRFPPLLPHQRTMRAMGCLSAVLILCVCYFSRSVIFKWPCVFHAMSGLPCPLCGGTRAVCAILHGDLSTALRLNATALPALATLVVVGFLSGWEALRGRALADWSGLMRRNARWFPLVIPVMFAWWIFHLTTAVKASKPDLVDFKNPIAARIRNWLGNAR